MLNGPIVIFLYIKGVVYPKWYCTSTKFLVQIVIYSEIIIKNTLKRC